MEQTNIFSQTTADAYLSQSCMSEVLYGARKEGDNRKRPIRAAEVEKLILPQLSMKKQEDYSRCLKKIREIERNLDREIALAEARYFIAFSP